MSRRRRAALAAAGIVLMGVSGCAGLQPFPDTQLVFGDGQVYVHQPVDHDRIGVVVLHGYANDIQEVMGQGWSQLADSKHFTAIYPIRGASWNAGLCCGVASTEDRDDVSWLAGVIASVRKRFGLTTIYLVGNSNGGMMAERLVAERPDISRRVAVWGGAPEMPLPGVWPGYLAAYDGSKDQTVPHAGGTRKIAGHGVIIRSVGDTTHFLVDAAVNAVTVNGAGHEPIAAWASIAWRELSG